MASLPWQRLWSCTLFYYWRDGDLLLHRKQEIGKQHLIDRRSRRTCSRKCSDNQLVNAMAPRLSLRLADLSESGGRVPRDAELCEACCTCQGQSMISSTQVNQQPAGLNGLPSATFPFSPAIGRGAGSFSSIHSYACQCMQRTSKDTANDTQHVRPRATVNLNLAMLSPPGLTLGPASHPGRRQPTQGAAIYQPHDPRGELQDADSKENDQWTVDPAFKGNRSRLRQLCESVLCHNPTKYSNLLTTRDSLLGPYGHLERCSAWTHVAAALAYFGYSISCTARFDASIASNALAIAAAWTTTATFCVSVLFHVTAPDPYWSALTRHLDFQAIYVCVAINALADLGAATHSFENVPTASLVDAPLAALVLALFFAYRRSVKSVESTQVTEFGGCTFSIGMLRRRHDDGAHSALRQMTSFSFSVFYFTTTPAALQRLGDHGEAVLFLQILGFGVMVLGLVLDNFFAFPDRQLAAGRRFPLLQCGKTCGCVVSSHSIWHVLCFVSVAFGTAAREYALAVT